MKSRISSKFGELQGKKQKALVTYITAGDPNLSYTEKLVHELEKSGADIIELGVPFSDPLADGPTIQASHARALRNDTSVASVLKTVEKIRKRSEIPLVLMLSYNLIVSYGIEKFVKDCVAAGVDGIIPPDLSHDEAGEFCRKAGGLDTIFLVAPTSTDDRVREIVRDSRGFVYVVSLAGITGARAALPSDIEANIARVRKYSKTPVCVGFGISKPSQVAQICMFADGVIVGSAIVKMIEAKASFGAIGKFVKTLKAATNG